MTSVPAIETAREAAKRLARPMLDKGFRPEALHTYTDPTGQPIFWRIRAKHPGTGEKWIRPMHRNGPGFELGEPAFDGPKPLYRLHELISAADGAVVFVVEGEKPADALVKRGLLVTTSGGADSARKTDWSPLKRLKPIVWRDTDQAGQNYQHEVLTALRALGISARVIDVPALGLPEKDDAFDWLAAHPEATAAGVLALPALEAVRKVAGRGDEAPQHVARNAPQDTTAGRIAYRRASDVQAKPIRWLWKGRIARGKVSMLAGNPGLGKSQVTASMAALVSTGGQWPVDRTRCECGNVIVLSAEDDTEDTIRPRLEAAGADLSRVFIIDAVIDGVRPDGGEVSRAFNLKVDLARLAALLEEIGDVALIVIDPITAYLGDTDSHVNAEVRALLAPLSEMAAEAGAAVVCVSHLNKGGTSDTLMRVTGSLAFVAAARAAFIVAKDQEDGNRRLFLPMKNNLGNDQTGLAFTVHGAQVPSPAGMMETARVVWEAETWLRDLLTEEGGKVDRRDVMKAAHAMGFKDRTVHRAREKLGLAMVQSGFGKDKRSFWNWPESLNRANEPQSCQPQSGGTNGDLGTIGAPATSSRTGSPRAEEF